jgi:signal peptidase I
MKAMFANLTAADFSGRSKEEPRTGERQRVHALFDEVQIAIYNDDRARRDVLSGIRTLASAGVYAILIVTFGFQSARVDGLSMEPTLQDRDRLIVNRLAYPLGESAAGDIVMLYYPGNPAMLFVKRVIAREGDIVRSEDGTVYVNDEPLGDEYVRDEFRSHDD